MAETLLKIENLTKEYEGQKILDGINLEVKQGDVLVVVGPSGCGKSTLLRCINALEPIQGGTIKLQGMDIRKGSKISPPCVRRSVWYSRAMNCSRI